jgi:hypothetical protein
VDADSILFADFGVVARAASWCQEWIRSAIGMSLGHFDDIIFLSFGDGGFEAADAVRSVPVRASRETPYGATTNEVRRMGFSPCGNLGMTGQEQHGPKPIL